MPVIPTGYRGYVKRISATCNNATNIHEVWINRISPTSIYTFFDSYFVIGKEWITGDVPIEDYNIWTISIDNNAAGNVSFAINIYWIESLK